MPDAEGRLLSEQGGSTVEASTSEVLWAWGFLVILLVMLLCIVCVCCGIFARLCGIGGWIFVCFTRAGAVPVHRLRELREAAKRKPKVAPAAKPAAKPAPRPSAAVAPVATPAKPSRVTSDVERADLCAGFACCGLGAWCGLAPAAGASGGSSPCRAAATT